MKHKEIELTDDFKEVEGFPNYYVNSEGTVGKKLQNGKLRIYEADKRGSFLMKDDTGKPRRRQQCHLVAAAFLNNYRTNQRLYFRDGNRFNAKLENIFIDDREFSDEVWKDIPGFSNYQISSKGRVRSLDRMQIVISAAGNFYQRTLKGRVMSPMGSNTGGHCCMTSDEGETKNVVISSLYKKMFG